MSAISLPNPAGLRPYPAKGRIEVAPCTGPLDVLQGRRLLVLADAENLRYSARDLGARLSYGRLAHVLRRVAASCSLHSFFSRRPGDHREASYFVARGWVPHPRDIESVRTCRGTETRANSDNVLLFGAGVLASHSRADVIVLASGDGDLVCDLARCLRGLPRARQVVTLSLAGSTSWRLDASRNPDISANIEIGSDCLRR